MHPCLDNQYILDAILGLLRDQQRTLLNVALTCKRLQDPALDIIWKSQPSLFNLIKTMPQNLLATKRFITVQCSSGWSSGDWYLVFTRIPTDADWSRFAYYGRKIHELGYHNPDQDGRHSTIDWDLIATIRDLCPRSAFLPHVISAGISLSHSPSLILDLYLERLGSQLTEVALSGVIDCEPLVAVAKSCPQLLAFDIEISWTEELDFKRMTEILSGMTQLRRVKLDTPGDIPDQLLQTLGELPSIQEYIAYTPSFPEYPSSLLSPESFPSLISLELGARDWSLSTNIVPFLKLTLRNLTIRNTRRAFHIRSLEERKFAIYDEFSEPISHILTSIGTYAPTLTDLRIFDDLGTISVHNPSATRPHPIEAEFRTAYASLFSLCALKTLRLTGSYMSYLDDAWLASAATSWPHLSSLQILGHWSIARATLRGYIPIIEKCRALDDLEITATWKPFDPALLSGLAPNPWITRLSNRSITVEQPMQVYTCLKEMFPNLVAFSGVPGDLRVRWGEDLEAIRELRYIVRGDHDAYRRYPDSDQPVMQIESSRSAWDEW